MSTGRSPIFCLPSPSPTLEAVQVSFVSWSRSHPQHADERALDGLLRSASEPIPARLRRWRRSPPRAAQPLTRKDSSVPHRLATAGLLAAALSLSACADLSPAQRTGTGAVAGAAGGALIGAVASNAGLGAAVGAGVGAAGGFAWTATSRATSGLQRRRASRTQLLALRLG